MPRQRKEATVILRMSQDLKQRLAQIAEVTGATMSETIRSMIEKTKTT